MLRIIDGADPYTLPHFLMPCAAGCPCPAPWHQSPGNWAVRGERHPAGRWSAGPLPAPPEKT